MSDAVNRHTIKYAMKYNITYTRKNIYMQQNI